jgi:RNA polymerase sigma factor (sigma-70 family)
VLSVARRVVGHLQDAEDVFQAVFLVLVKKAATIQRRELLANWLYGVAYRTALEARTAKARRRAREIQRITMPERAVNTVANVDVAGEVPDIIDQELCRLPEKYRAAVVLCDVEGRPRKDVARQLRIPEGTLSSRLATARQRLARRLARRGVALSAGALAAALTHSTAVAAPSAALVSATVRTAALLSAGAPAAGAVSAKVLTLFDGVLHAMFLTKLKNTALVLIGLCVLGVSFSLLPQGAAASRGTERSPAAQGDKRAGPPATADDLKKIEAEKLAQPDPQVSANNLKQLALAMHNYHDNNGSLPANAIYDGDGKPLLSWRVAILPYIDQKDLYDQFKLDQPWDSEHNKKLLAKMPEVYGTKGDKTIYQVFAGKGSIFDGKEGVQLMDITDGTSNTILFAEAAQAVPWTKPADLAYKPGEKLPKLGGLFKDGFNVALADGSVRFIPAKFNEKAMHALITRAGGEVIGFDDLERMEEEKQEATKPAAIESPRR